MKIIASPSEPIEKIDEPLMPPGMCALVGDEEVAFLKNGKITVMSLEEIDRLSESIARATMSMKRYGSPSTELLERLYRMRDEVAEANDK